jgi:hypothetical protein
MQHLMGKYHNVRSVLGAMLDEKCSKLMVEHGQRSTSIIAHPRDMKEHHDFLSFHRDGDGWWERICYGKSLTWTLRRLAVKRACVF